MVKPIPDELFEIVDGKYDVMETGCWPWLMSVNGKGYGQINFKRKNYKAHRVVYEMMVGKVPANKQLDHLCRNRRCVNPRHLEVVDSRTNTLRGVGASALNARKTHCRRGHPLSGKNIYKSGGYRQCRACNKIYKTKRTTDL